MRQRTSSVVVSIIVGALLTGCGHNLHASPPGLAEHQVGNTANAPANQSGGTCTLYTTAQVQAVFGGQVSAGQADNLTPGLDRCNWTITKSILSSKPLELAAYRPLSTEPNRGHPRKDGTVLVPALGPGATYAPTTFTLSYIHASKTTSLQLITNSRLTKPHQARVESALIKLAQN